MKLVGKPTYSKALILFVLAFLWRALQLLQRLFFMPSHSAILNSRPLPRCLRHHRQVPGLAAEAAGVLPGDVLVAVDGHAIHNNWDLMDYRRTLHGGDAVDLTLLREGKEIHCLVTLTATK